MKIIFKLSPAQALREANERYALEQIRRAIASDLAKLLASLPQPRKD